LQNFTVRSGGVSRAREPTEVSKILWWCTLAPDPHPLDFDWRFDDATVSELVERLGSGRLLLIGCPSIATALAELRRSCWLVDRQPYYEASEFVHASRIDLRYEDLARLDLGVFDAILIDSPWYTDYLATWLAEALHHSAPGGRLLFSLWPMEVRPAASDEAEVMLAKASLVGQPVVEVGALGYKTPTFEIAAAAATGRRLSAHWRRGDLVTVAITKLPVKSLTQPVRAAPPEAIWERFVFDETQIALRVSSKRGQEMPALFELGLSGVLPDVSRRLSLRAEIDLWTSDNLVFRVEGTSHFLLALEEIMKGSDDPGTPTMSPALKLLLSRGVVGSRPFRRKFRWQHFV
jgi:hypothetical protein